MLRPTVQPIACAVCPGEKFRNRPRSSSIGTADDAGVEKLPFGNTSVMFVSSHSPTAPELTRRSKMNATPSRPWVRKQLVRSGASVKPCASTALPIAGTDE